MQSFHKKSDIRLGMFLAFIMSLISWGLIFSIAVYATGCVPINFEASGSFNMGENQGIHRRSESKVRNGASTEEVVETPKPTPVPLYLPPASVVP
jgi:hypothetical protein